MNKLIATAAFVFVVLFGLVAVNVKAQTASPTSSPTSTAVPSGAPQTGYGLR